MSDSKKDLTRIEDLGEYLHQLDDDEDYLPDLPTESEPPAFMEETLISDDPFSNSEDSETKPFESELSDFGSEPAFSSEEDSSDNSFADAGETFGSESFGESSDFSSDSFSTESNFEDSESFSEEDPFSDNSETSFTSENTDNGFELSNDDFKTDEFSVGIDEESSPKKDSTIITSEFTDTRLEDTRPLFETPPVQEEHIEKTPITKSEPASTYKAPENFEELKNFAENASFTGMPTEGNPSFSVLIKDIKFLEDAQDILTLLKELGLAMDSDEVLQKRLMRGEFLVPRISEFAATLLSHKLRRFDIDILVGPSDKIQPPKYGQEPEIGLVSKHNLYQNQSHHFQFDEFNLDISQIVVSATPTLDGYQVIKYMGVASEHKMLEGYLVEDENSLEISSHYQELAQKLKAHALKQHANAVVGINYQLTPLPSQFGTSYTRYRLTCTGNLVWINRI